MLKAIIGNHSSRHFNRIRRRTREGLRKNARDACSPARLGRLAVATTPAPSIAASSGAALPARAAATGTKVGRRGRVTRHRRLRWCVMYGRFYRTAQRWPAGVLWLRGARGAGSDPKESLPAARCSRRGSASRRPRPTGGGEGTPARRPFPSTFMRVPDAATCDSNGAEMV